MIDIIIKNFPIYFPEVNMAISTGLIILARMIGFVKFAPGFTRKEFPSMVRLSFAVIFTIILTPTLGIKPIPTDCSLILSIGLNVLFGALIAYIANCIILVVEAGGDMINMQMGLQAASVMDPSSGSQTSVMGRYFAIMAIVLFINLGGFYWLFNAFIKSFEIFPIYAQGFSIDSLINLRYLVEITSNILYIGMQIAAPVLIATLGQDIILGIISRTAPQVNVFQMSFLFKPVFGVAILIWVMGSLINVINDYFLTFSHIF